MSLTGPGRSAARAAPPFYAWPQGLLAGRGPRRTVADMPTQPAPLVRLRATAPDGGALDLREVVLAVYDGRLAPEQADLVIAARAEEDEA